MNLTQWWEDYLDRRQPGKSVEDAKAGRMIAAPDTSSPLSLQIVGAVGANGKNPALMRV
ncbi:MAG: hypothetical protein KAY82_04735 [Hylemonella sp.]|nr:hypothetical protein [Hylemonella sp.]